MGLPWGCPRWGMPRGMPLAKDAIRRLLRDIGGAVMGGATLIGRWCKYRETMDKESHGYK